MFTVGGKNSRSATGDFENQRDRHPDIPIFQNFNLKVSAEAENQLQIKSDGAYVPPLSWQTVEGA